MIWHILFNQLDVTYSWLWNLLNAVQVFFCEQAVQYIVVWISWDRLCFMMLFQQTGSETVTDGSRAHPGQDQCEWEAVETSQRRVRPCVRRTFRHQSQAGPAGAPNLSGGVEEQGKRTCAAFSKRVRIQKHKYCHHNLPHLHAVIFSHWKSRCLFRHLYPAELRLLWASLKFCVKMYKSHTKLCLLWPTEPPSIKVHNICSVIAV